MPAVCTICRATISKGLAGLCPKCGHVYCFKCYADDDHQWWFRRTGDKRTCSCGQSKFDFEPIQIDP
jgi:hypothetical protein